MVAVRGGERREAPHSHGKARPCKTRYFALRHGSGPLFALNRPLNPFILLAPLLRTTPCRPDFKRKTPSQGSRGPGNGPLPTPPPRASGHGTRHLLQHSEEYAMSETLRGAEIFVRSLIDEGV